MAEKDTKWLRKATDIETMYEMGNRNQVYLTHNTLHLSSAKPISEGMLLEALTHLYRQVPVLRVCLQERNGELWLKEIERCHIDLKVVVGNLEEEEDKLTLHSYISENGPLWCVRFLQISNDTLSKSSLSHDNDFSYHYALLFGIHHAIADGETFIKLVTLLCNILDDIVSGKPIDDEHQLGDLTDGEEVSTLYKQEMARLRQDKELWKELQKEVENGSKVLPLLRNVCKIPHNVIIMSKIVEITFDRDISERFGRRAKSKGIYLHAALTGLINLALSKLLQESGIIQEEYDIRVGHNINLRRYYKGDSSRALGCILPAYGYSSSFIVPKDMITNFWETVTEFHGKFHSDMSNRNFLTTCAYRMLTEDTIKNYHEMFSTDKDYRYYGLSNSGNLAGLLFEKGDSIILNKITAFSSIRNQATCMVVYVHTFRGQLNMSFVYSTKFLTHEFVNRLKELVHTYMISICIESKQ